jgi:hypothetical protein
MNPSMDTPTRMQPTFPTLQKTALPLMSMAEHEAALQAACEMAVELLQARGITEPAQTEADPLPQSTIDLLRRMPRS